MKKESINKTTTTKKSFNFKKLKYGVNSVALIAVVTAIFVVLNVVLSNFDYKLDLTPNSLYSLTESSKKIIDKVKPENEVHIYGLYDEVKASTTRVETSSDELLYDISYSTLTDEIKLYESYSDGNITVKFVDPSSDPTFLSSIGVADRVKTSSDAIFVVQGVAGELGMKTRLVSRSDLVGVRYDYTGNVQGEGLNMEQAISGAIQYVTSETTAKMYFIEGHNETSYQNYTALTEALNQNNYELSSINLNVSEKIPDDADMIAFLSPDIDVSTDERDIINDYLRKGGNAVFIMDGNEDNVSYDNINYILDSYGLKINEDIIYDESRHYLNDKYILHANGADTGINSEIGGANFAAIVDKACSIQVLGKTNADLFSASILDTLDTSEVKNGSQGTKSVVAGAEYLRGENSSRVLVLGDSDFLSDECGATFSDDLLNEHIKGFVNWANWAQNVIDQVYIQPVSLDTHTLSIDNVSANVIIYITAIGIPLIIFIFGFVVWIKRRHL